MSKDLSGAGLASLAVGGVLVWTGLKGYSLLKAAENVIQGKSPNDGQNATALTSGAAGTTTGGPAPTVAGTYNHAQLMQLWTSQGGSSASANNAACHAIQESSGNPKAQSANPDGGINYGLWQLDTKGVGAGHSPAQLMDPATNCRITVAATHNGANWSQWATPGC